MRGRAVPSNTALTAGLLLTLVAACLLLAASPAHAKTFTVNSTGDGGDVGLPSGVCNTAPFQVETEPECTLRAALEEANATIAADTINFNIGGSGVKTISPASPLPFVTQPVTIDGYSEPGASMNTLAVGSNAVLRIRLDGGDAGFASGLNITANDSVVRGLSVTRFSSTGLILSGTDNNKVEGNFLGITPGGKDLGNSWGLGIQNNFVDPTNKASDNTVGGTSPEARNIISGNGTGVQITSGSNKVQGNYIGTTKSGTGALGNTFGGVLVSFQGANNTIGGVGAARNTIAFNGQDGVRVSDATAMGNSILSNSIFSNSGLGIDLRSSTSGVTANDGPGDADTGPNNLQNFPSLSSAKTGRKATTIKGTLKSTKNATFAIQFFKNPKSTRDEGKKFIGQKIVTDTDGDGIMPFTFKPKGKVKAGLFVTATATNNATTDTSEFSSPKKAQSA
jgi:hypothetical protein